MHTDTLEKNIVPKVRTYHAQTEGEYDQGGEEDSVGGATEGLERIGGGVSNSFRVVTTHLPYHANIKPEEKKSRLVFTYYKAALLV